ncbi:MAG: Gfo/Idh/MocA family oxidoreductase, partial [Pseudomonadota bacterium]
LSAIADPSDAAREFVRAQGVPFHSSLADLLDAGQPDGIILATPNHLHVEQGLACIETGVPVLIEKPVADRLDKGLALLEAADRTNAKVLVGHHRRYSAIIARAIELIEQGALGRITAVSVTELLYKPDDYFAGPNAWRTRSGGGPALINLIHDIGNLRALAGEIVELHALTSSAVRRHEVEDTAAISLRFASGALCTIILSDTAASDRSWEHSSGEDRDNFARAHVDDVDCYLIAGTEGSLGIPTLQLRRFGEGVERSWLNPLERSRSSVEPVDPLAAQIAHFCDVIQGKAEPLVSLRDGLANLAVIEAINQSARTGERVAIKAL